MQLKQLKIFRYPNLNSVTQFIRMAEYYENPKYRGQVVSRNILLKYFKTKFHINYESYYEGFNVPGYVIKMLDKNCKDKTVHERFVCNRIRQMDGTECYVIAYVKGDDTCLSHELSHAFFYLSTEYKKECLRRLAVCYQDTQYLMNKVRRDLMKKMGYRFDVIDDELIAYLVDGGGDIKAELRIKIEPLATLISDLRKIFTGYLGRLCD